MGASINVHRVGSDVLRGSQILEHREIRTEDAPITVAHTITALTTAKYCEVKRAMDKWIGVGEVNVLVEWEEVVTRGICLRCIGRPDEVPVGRRPRPHQVRPRMIVEPITLIHCIHA